jgi:hypothetical protein
VKPMRVGRCIAVIGSDIVRVNSVVLAAYKESIQVLMAQCKCSRSISPAQGRSKLASRPSGAAACTFGGRGRS